MANRYRRSMIGMDPLLSRLAGGSTATTYDMNTGANKAIAFFFVAPAKASDGSALDVWSVWINWSAAATPGTVTLRIETVDTTTSPPKPTGTLYDANATITFTPAAGWQQVTFASHPTTTLTPGTVYAIVMLTATTGTSQTLRGYFSPTNGWYPVRAQTATDGSTRANFADVSKATPICTLGMSDGSEDSAGMCPWAVGATAAVFGTQAAGMKFIVPTGETWTIGGVYVDQVTIAGTPDDFRMRIFDSGNNLVAGTSWTVKKNFVLTSQAVRVPFSPPVTLSAGTYRLVVDCPLHTSTSVNKYTVYGGQARVATVNPDNLIWTTSADVTLSPGSIVWTDDATIDPVMGLILADLPDVVGGTTYVFLSGD